MYAHMTACPAWMGTDGGVPKRHGAFGARCTPTLLPAPTLNCLPHCSLLLSPFREQAWVFAALEDEENARTYYYLAALYALPLLRSGFDFDWFTITMLLAGVAHVQVGCWVVGSSLQPR